MQYEGDVYRPPSEARSLIIQVTIGCSHNTCTFCHMYTGKQFRIRKREEILRDLEECSIEYGPYVERVTAYGTASDVLRKSEEELTALAKAGLEMVYLGAESGDDEILRQIQKGQTAAELIEAGRKLKRCGIKTSVTLISGLGGPDGMEKHALGSAKLINEMNPEYAAILSLQLREDSPMAREVLRGERQLLTADQTVEETEIFLRAIDSPGTVFRSNHASNFVALAGVFNQDIPLMLQQLEEAKAKQRYRPEWMREL